MKLKRILENDLETILGNNACRPDGQKEISRKRV